VLRPGDSLYSKGRAATSAGRQRNLMKPQIINIILLSLVLTYCTIPQPQKRANFSCGEQLSGKEINTFNHSGVSGYTDEDLSTIAEITDLVIHHFGDTSENEVFYNTKLPNSLAIEIYGVEQLSDIDSISCKIFNSKSLKLPNDLTLLFHKYVNGANDGGIVAALRRKANARR